MILLHKFIYAKKNPYSAGYNLSINKYCSHSMSLLRGKFSYGKYSVFSEKYITINYSLVIWVEIIPPDTQSICFVNENFNVNLVFKKDARYACHIFVPDDYYNNFTPLEPEKIETQTNVYKFYYNAEKNNVERYRNAKGNYEV